MLEESAAFYEDFLVKLHKAAGARYVVPAASHHANTGSDLNRVVAMHHSNAMIQRQGTGLTNIGKKPIFSKRITHT